MNSYGMDEIERGIKLVRIQERFYVLTQLSIYGSSFNLPPDYNGIAEELVQRGLLKKLNLEFPHYRATDEGEKVVRTLLNLFENTLKNYPAKAE